MPARLARIAPLILASALVAACDNTNATPGIGEQTAPAGGGATPPASMAPAGSVSGEAMTTFCDQWATDVASAWPPDAAAAARLAPMFTTWAQSPALATVGADLTTVGTWLQGQASAGTVAAPDENTAAAFSRIGEFVNANCH